MKKTAAFLSLGCKVNSYETEAMRGLFEESGYRIVEFKETADVYVVNTCTVTNIADRKSRQMLHQAKKRNPEAVIAAVGCYVQAAEQELLEDSAVDIIVGNNKKSDIVHMVERFLENRVKEELIADIGAQSEYETLQLATTMDKTRAFIKIQDGCNRFCSYCIIPYVRGRVRSRDEEDVLKEISELALRGYKEIVFTGIHISSYGTDKIKEPEQDNPMPLARLILKAGEVKGIERIRLGSLEPRIITKDFVKAMQSVRQFCPHFHLSLQSGSNSVLARMNRKYTSEEYYEKTLLIRKYFDHPAFTTDVIVGFPGETGEEFEETKAFVSKIGFSHIHVFKYSKREGTKAAVMKEQVPEEIKNQRSNELIGISNFMSQEYKSVFMGKIEKILIEEEIHLDNHSYLVGHNERYEKIALHGAGDLINEVVSVKVCNKLTEELLLAEIIH